MDLRSGRVPPLTSYLFTCREKARQRHDFDLVDAVHAAEASTLPVSVPPLEPEHQFAVTLEPDTFTEEKYQLYATYQTLIHHEAEDDTTRAGFRRFLCNSPLQRTTRTITEPTGTASGDHDGPDKHASSLANSGSSSGSNVISSGTPATAAAAGVTASRTTTSTTTTTSPSTTASDTTTTASEAAAATTPVAPTLTKTIHQNLGSFHQCYRLNGKLIALSVLDLLPHAVSGVYFIYDPEYARWSPGKLSALRELALAAEAGHGYYYMGYYIHGCPKMRYKAEFRPQLVLDPESMEWGSFDAYLALLEHKKYVSLARERRLMLAEGVVGDGAAATPATATAAGEVNDGGVSGLNEVNGYMYSESDDDPDVSSGVDTRDRPFRTASAAANAVAAGMSLFDIGFPGMMTLEEVCEAIDLDNITIKLGEAAYPAQVSTFFPHSLFFLSVSLVPVAIPLVLSARAGSYCFTPPSMKYSIQIVRGPCMVAGKILGLPRSCLYLALIRTVLQVSFLLW